MITRVGDFTSVDEVKGRAGLKPSSSLDTLPVMIDQP